MNDEELIEEITYSDGNFFSGLTISSLFGEILFAFMSVAMLISFVIVPLCISFATEQSYYTVLLTDVEGAPELLVGFIVFLSIAILFLLREMNKLDKKMKRLFNMWKALKEENDED